MGSGLAVRIRRMTNSLGKGCNTGPKVLVTGGSKGCEVPVAIDAAALLRSFEYADPAWQKLKSLGLAASR
jgi:predicted deacylase